MKISLIFLVFLFFISCQNSEKPATRKYSIAQKGQKYNQLKNANSLYLQEHADNPVRWYEWNDSIIAFAEKKNKPILLSIGYYSCHWCNVMEEENFTKSKVAKLMNSKFVNVKIDREEHPDLDAYYFDWLEKRKGWAGWPLNIILLPTGKAIWGGVYFKQEQWIDTLEKYSKLIAINPNKVEKNADVLFSKNKEFNLTENLEDLFQLCDTQKGGLIPTFRNRKYPLPTLWNYLLAKDFNNKNKKWSDFIKFSLDKQATGGLFDHIEGGFFRFSIDEDWKVPHFEKMLYDNAQLLSVYAKAYKVFKKPLYKDVLYKTSQFLDNYLQHSKGGYFSSTAADTEGEEGKYYKWTSAEIDAVLGAESKWFKGIVNIKKGKEWESNYFLLYPDRNLEILSSRNQNIRFETCRKKLEEYKSNNRVRPNIDSKIITSWNAMLLSGFIDAYLSTNDNYFLQKATSLAKFLNKKVHKAEIVHILNYESESYLEDYAFLVEAFIKMYQLSSDESYLNTAHNLTIKAIEIFFYKKESVFRNSVNNQLLKNDYINIKDNAIPSSNSVMLENILNLSIILSNDYYIDLYKVLSDKNVAEINRNVIEYTNWKRIQETQKKPFYQVVITGNKAEEFYKKLSLFHFSNAFIIWSNNEKNTLEIFENRFTKKTTTIYICTENACLQTQTNINAVTLFLRN